MIKVTFKTNLDDYKRCKWPTVLACRPEMGDRVKSECGKILKVCGITHTSNTFSGSQGQQETPLLIIELHNRK